MSDYIDIENRTALCILIIVCDYFTITALIILFFVVFLMLILMLFLCNIDTVYLLTGINTIHD